MNGETIKNLLKRTGLSIADIAAKMDVTPQALNSTFNSPDVKSGIIEKLCLVLDLPITFFYGGCANEIINSPVYGDNNAVAGINSSATAGADKETINRLIEEMAALRKQNEKLMDKLLNS